MQHVPQGDHFENTWESFQYYFPSTSASRSRSHDQRMSRIVIIAWLHEYK